MKHLFTAIILLGGFLPQLRAQDTISDTLQLKEVTIQATGQRYQQFYTGNHIQHLDVRTIRQIETTNLTDILTNHSLAVVKSYGYGGLSSISMRGTNSNHTAILWNGFNLQSPLNGGMNASLIPATFLDQVDIQHGGSGALFGSGNIGGAIHLNNKATFNQGMQISASQYLGSFGFRQSGTNIKFSNQWYAGSLRFFTQQADNNFYYTKPGIIDKRVRQKNASFCQWGLLQENTLRLPNQHEIALRFWYQQSERDIQPNIPKGDGKEHQNDFQIRLAAEWKHQREKSQWQFRSMLSKDSLEYYDPVNLNRPKSVLTAWSWVSEAEMARHFGKKMANSYRHTINIGLFNQYELGNTQAYAKKENRWRKAIFASLRSEWMNQRLITFLNAREEMMDDKTTPITLSTGSKIKLSKSLQASANLARTYRVPTFNDLFWLDGFAKGNPNLKAENGWTQEAGVHYKQLLPGGYLESSVTAYHHLIKDLIVWEAIDGIWSPVNKPRVRSYGLETEANLTRTLGQLQNKFSIAWAYTRSFEDLKKGPYNTDQLHYIPEHVLRTTWRGSLHNWSGQINGSFTGPRPIPDSFVKKLGGYWLLNLNLAKKFILKNYQLKFHFSINNLLNTEYQAHYQYAMPGIHFTGGISIRFN